MNTKKSQLGWAHPLVREWFVAKFGSPTEPQMLGWPAILAHQTTLISAPTGSGKTFAAFLTCIDSLVRQALNHTLCDETEVIYISPLKALSNDIHKNLSEPLNEIAALAKTRGLQMAEIRIAVRTGDTPQRERISMVKKPPHLLVTTPESFFLLLTAEKSRVMLTTIKTIIVDEIHALVNDKRGTHLALSLERLETITKHPVRIGLSATQKPLQRVAQFLAGNRKKKPTIIDIGHVRHLDLAVETPRSPLSAVATNEMWDEMYDKLAEFSQDHRSILVFVNTRRLAERVAHHLAERIGIEYVATHHGSLSRIHRFNAETRLKNGELKILVATASLELGIDIGSIDLVCQMGSPRAISVALQRIGRAGHWRGAISKGRLFATTRDELIECAALIYAIHQGELDQLIMPQQPLDILAQQIVAACATNDWHEDDLYRLVKKAYPYHDLTRETFNAIIEMLSEGISGARSRYSAYLFRDQINHVIKARRGARLTAILNGGAIPDNGLFTVILEPKGTMIGTLDEDFAVESNRGDIILLGTTSWQIERVESRSGRVIVHDAHGAPPSVPFWRGEAPPRSNELSQSVSALRILLSEKLSAQVTQTKKNNVVKWLKNNCGLNDNSAAQCIAYLLQGRAILGAVPSQTTIIAERFFDESGGMQLIIHSPFGSHVNKAWALALRKKFCRSFNFELQAAATEDGINISLLEQHSFPLQDVFKFLHQNSVREVLTQAALQTPIFKRRWRWVATRSLALKKFRSGKKIPPNILRMLADDLLGAVFPDAAACQDNLAGQDIMLPDHPLINETMKDLLNEALDVNGLITLLQDIQQGKIKCLAVDTAMPSPFAHEILNANPYAFLDDAPLEERRARAVQMRNVLPNELLNSIGKLDVDVIHDVQMQAWPDIRSADELHDLLQTVIALPLDFHLDPYRTIPAAWHEYYEQLQTAGRIVCAHEQTKIFWLAAEKVKQFKTLYPHAVLQQQTKEIAEVACDYDQAVLNLLSGWLHYLGPITSHELTNLFAIQEDQLDIAFLKLESTGMILRGSFRTLFRSPIEWCERRLLARIHRLTLDKLRKEIAPITAEQYADWLLVWQHQKDGTQLHDEAGLLEVINQMQGYELPANAWESQIFAKRIVNYDRSMLDNLCLRGLVGWGRLAPIAEAKAGKRIRPTSISPITFFNRDNLNWVLPKPTSLTDKIYEALSAVAKDIYRFLKEKGASFFNDILRHVHHLKSEVEMGLWELIAAGLITADSFDNLRALIDPKRRNDYKKRRLQARFSAGRWSVLHAESNVLDNALQHEAICWLLLKRYGVVFREILLKEKNMPRWRDLLIVLRTLEARGEIRGGRFVSGYIGEQFALNYAVESLRAHDVKVYQ